MSAEERERLLALLAEAREALEPFAKGADGRRRKDILGAVCFRQGKLLSARATLSRIDAALAAEPEARA